MKMAQQRRSPEVVGELFRPPGRHAALLQALCHREQQAVGSTALLQTRVSEAALGSARLHARVASCLHGVSRHHTAVAAAKRISADFGDARSALLDNAHRAMCIALFSTDETLSCPLSAGGGHHRQVGSKLSIFQRQRYCLALNELIMGHCVAQRVSLSFTRKCGPKLTGFLTRSKVHVRKRARLVRAIPHYRVPVCGGEVYRVTPVSASRVLSSSGALAAPPAVTQCAAARAFISPGHFADRLRAGAGRRSGSGWRQGRVRWGRPLLSRPRGAVDSGPAAVLAAVESVAVSAVTRSCGCVVGNDVGNVGFGLMVVRFVRVICHLCARVRPCVPCVSRVCPGCRLPRCLFTGKDLSKTRPQKDRKIQGNESGSGLLEFCGTRAHSYKMRPVELLRV